MAVMSEIIEGLQILDKHSKSKSVGAEHDTFYAGDCTPDDIPDEEIKRLESIGWYWNTAYERWCHFV